MGARNNKQAATRAGRILPPLPEAPHRPPRVKNQKLKQQFHINQLNFRSRERRIPKILRRR